MKGRGRRGIFFAVLSSLVFLLIIARLAQLQLLEGEFWQEKATLASERELKVPARRGGLFDRNGTPLAVSDHRCQVGVFRPEYWRGAQRSANLARLLGLTAESVRQSLRGREGHVVLHRSALLSPAVEDSLRTLYGLTCEPATNRNYPLGDVAARIIGRINRAGVGDAGFEEMFQERLAGCAGRALVRYDGGLRQSERERLVLTKPRDGEDIVLTLDRNVQMLIDAELVSACERATAESGMAIAVNIEDAEILAIAQYPNLDRERRGGYDASRWQSRAAVAAFEPGSTFKVFTAASLLSHAVCDTATRFSGEKVPGQRRAEHDMGGFTFQDVHPVCNVSFRHAFAVSSNIIFGKAAGLLRREEFSQDLRNFGFGERTGIGWPLESAGILRAPERWSERSQPTLAIGQEIGVTLLQLATAYRAVFGDGLLRDLQVVRTGLDFGGNRRERELARRGRRVVAPALLSTLRAMCADVVDEDYGTGTSARVRGLELGGKTGTAQMIALDGQGYDAQRHVAGFVGFAPVAAPRVLVLLFLEGVRGQMRWGGISAAPAVGRIFEGLLLSTEHLDLPADRLVQEVAGRAMPDLAGRSADRVYELASASELEISPAAPGPDAVVVGQLPAAGTPLRAGSVRVQLAWSHAGKSRSR
ncbi:MAG TPA: penicillin-binding transpeptidase domain-containing protein [Candidatus Krumholzibacteria bacterium]|jgi:cell division protein FtsI (penicillin-binding protein 3)